jgi:tetratricopeptide (TPR) repeat protein
VLAIEAKNRKRYDDSARLYARAYSLPPYDPTLLVSYGEYLSEMGRPRYALAIAERLFRNRETWTDPRAVTLLLNSTGRVWGVDSAVAAAARLNARAPSARAALFVGMAYEVKGHSAAARLAYRNGLRRAPGDSALTVRARLVGGFER